MRQIRFKRSRLQRTISRSNHFLNLERLEARVLLHAGMFEVHPLFAPDTPAEYAEQVHRLAHSGHDPTQSDTSDRPHHQGCCCADCTARLSEIGQFQFDDEDRWSQTPQSGNGLSQGDPTTITWSIVPDGTNIDGFIGEEASASNLVSTLREIYGIPNDPRDTSYADEAWFEAIASSFDRWSELSGVQYVYEPSDDGANFGFFGGAANVRGDVRIGGHPIDGNSGTLAYNFFPDTSDMVIDTADAFFADTSDGSLRLRNVIAHEAGHGLGVSHVESSSGSFLMEPFINLGFEGPQFDDILSTHRGYGDAFEGNDSAATATNLGEIKHGQTISIGDDAMGDVVRSDDRDFVSIDGDSDVDFYRFTISDFSDIDVLLDPVGPTYSQGSQGGTQSPFDASSQNDLSIEIIDSNGATVLARSDSGSLGATEWINGLQMPGPGEYFVSVSGTRDATQMYHLELTATKSSATPGITLAQSGGSTAVSEGGNADAYSIVLDSRPTGAVTITVETNGQVVSSPSVLTFTPANWDVPQAVTVIAVDDRSDEGSHRDAIRHKVDSFDARYDRWLMDDVLVEISDNDTVSPRDEIFFSVRSGGIMEGLSVSDEDIVAWDGSELRMVFDGSDVGLSGLEIDAFDVVNESMILMSFTTASGSIDDSDIVLFEATSLGEYTAGTFFGYVDGSDVSLTTNGEDIDAMTLLDDGSLLFSTTGTAQIPGGLGRDEDVVRFIPSSLGTQTSGTFETFLDGSNSAIGLATNSGEDIDGVAVANGELYLTTIGDFSVPRVSGADDDVFVWDTSSNTFDTRVFLNLTRNDIGGIDFPGIASASSIGIGSSQSISNPYIAYSRPELSVTTDGFKNASVEASVPLDDVTPESSSRNVESTSNDGWRFGIPDMRTIGARLRRLVAFQLTTHDRIFLGPDRDAERHSTSRNPSTTEELGVTENRLKDLALREILHEFRGHWNRK